MPKLSFMDSLLRRGKRSISSDILKTGPVLNMGEGEQIILTYTSVADKMKVFSAFVREGLENGDLVDYNYPDEEDEIVREKLKEYGVEVEKYEREGSLVLGGLSKYFMIDGKLDYDNAVVVGLNMWNAAKEKGYKHYRGLEDLADFFFVNGRWQEFVTHYWLNPKWDDPTISKWVKLEEAIGTVGAVYEPFIMSVTAFNVEGMTKEQVNEIWKSLEQTAITSRRFFMDLLGNVNSFSRLIGLNHDRLIGRRILLEFDPISNYEKVVDSLAKESMANVEPIFVFTSSTSPIHAHLADKKTVKFFLTSVSTSTPQTSSENKVLLPAKNTPLILDALSKVLETYADANVCFVFDILSELLTTMGQEKTFTFLRHALDLLSSKKITSLFLLNTSAHEAEVVYRVRNFFSNQLVYDKKGLKIIKTI